MEWAAIDTLVKLTKRNVDAAQTSENIENKLENCSRRHFSCKCYIKHRHSTLVEDSWTTAVDVPVINIIVNTNTDRVESA